MPQPAGVFEVGKVRYSALQPAISQAAAPVGCCPPNTSLERGMGTGFQKGVPGPCFWRV